MYNRIFLAFITKLLALVVILGLVILVVFGCKPVQKKMVEPTKEAARQGFASGIFIETKTLQRMLNDSRLVLVDARPVENYQVVHLPGAVNLAKDTWRKPEDLAYKRQHGFATSPAKAKQVFGSIGIGTNTRVVVYDSITFPDASVVWGLLKQYGHKDVRVLRGGYEKWVREGRLVNADPPKVRAAVFVPRPQKEMVATTEWLLKHSSEVFLVDMRSFEEYVGVNPAGNPRGGSVPGAINIEWKVLAGDSSIKAASELKRILAQNRVPEDKVLVTYCNWGIGRGTYGVMVLKALGYRKVRIYGGSMEDWSARTNLPIAESQSLGRGL